MEGARHHVAASNVASLRGFFGARAREDEPPDPSLRRNIGAAKCRHLRALASRDDAAAAIAEAMQGAQNSPELIRMIDILGGWAGMAERLEPGQIDQVAARLAQLLDQRDYVPWQMIRRVLFILDYDSGPTLGDVFMRLLRWPAEFQPAEFDAILARKAELLRTIASATLRGRAPMVRAALIPPGIIGLYDMLAPHREDALVRLMHEVNYTTRICAALEKLDCDDLYGVLLDMADPAILDARQREACRDRIAGLALEFAAAEGAVRYAGTQAAKAAIGRVTRARRAALETFAPGAPPGALLAAIAGAIRSKAGTLADLRTAIRALAETPARLSFTGPDADDTAHTARLLVSDAGAQDWLPRLPAGAKARLIDACLSGLVGEDDQIALIVALSAAKAHDPAELYQLMAAARWEALHSRLDGRAYARLEGLLARPV